MLTQKMGPLPVWAWGGIAAVGIWFFLLRGKKAAPTGTVAGTPTGQATTDYSLGYAQGIQSAFPAPTAAAPTTTAGVKLLPGPGQNPGDTIPFWTVKGRTPQVVGAIPVGATVQPTGAATVPADWPGYGAILGVPVSFQGYQGYVNAWHVPTGAVGGPGSMRKHAIGSRSSNLWHDAHPLIGAKVHYPHYVNVGGPAPFPQSDIRAGVPGRSDVGYGGPAGGHRAHVARVHAVAAQAGVHPARVLMLNPHPGRHMRIA